MCTRVSFAAAPPANKIFSFSTNHFVPSSLPLTSANLLAWALRVSNNRWFVLPAVVFCTITWLWLSIIELRESKGKFTLGSEGRSALETMGSTGAGSLRPGSSSGGAGAEKIGNNLEEETEADIILARRRREANDRYFQRVNAGVLDVVAKLEEVAGAMRAVEQESRDIWGESDSAGTSLHD